MFFDQLGPPWPKHACTDNPEHRSASYSVRPAFSTKAISLGIWRPFLIAEARVRSPNTRLKLQAGNKLSGSVLYVPETYRNLGPLFFRKDASDPRGVILSAWNQETGLESNLVRSVWVSDEERTAHNKGDTDCSGATLNSVAWSWSFAHDLNDSSGTPSNADVDLRIARKFFILAARKGDWSACNNLAVMMLRGLGRPAMSAFAVKLFAKSCSLARNLEPKPLQHLAHCYSEGIGVRIDPEAAARYSALAENAERHIKTAR